jgi:hypothetical protein
LAVGSHHQWRESRHESYGDERDTFDPTWGREIVDVDGPWPTNRR